MGFTASTLLDRWAKTAARDGVSCGGYGLRVMPTGEFQTSQHSDLDREDAIQIVTDNMTQTITAPAPAACPAPASEPKAPKEKTAPGPIAWDNLNDATQAFFFELVDGLPEGDWSGPLPKITLQVAPRLTMLKRAGVLTTEGKRTKTLHITAEGQRVHALGEAAD